MWNEGTGFSSDFIITEVSIGVLFIILKLLGVISWSWWWCLLIPFLPFITIFVVIGIAFLWVQVDRLFE